jgi:outer membrane cobalamin receptor
MPKIKFSILRKKNSFFSVGLLACFLVCSSNVFSQTSLTGKVSDGDGEAIIGAYVSNGQNTVATDLDGLYTLILSAGTHDIAISFIGMKTERKTFNVIVRGEKIVWDIVLKGEARALDVAVVSAGRFEQSVAEVTVSMEILQPALIENKATTSLESALEQTPGVSMVDGEPQIRSGSGFSYGAGSRVMVMVDDLPVLSGDAGRPNWGFLPLENLEQIEIIKGASSVLYGSSALSGVINIRTRFPDARPLTRISVQHGAYSTPRTSESVYWDHTLQQSNVRFLHSRRMGGWDIVIGGNILGDDGYKGPTFSRDSITGIPFDTLSAGYNPNTVDHFEANKQARINVNIRRRKSTIPGLTYGLSTNWQKGESLTALLWENGVQGIYSAFAGSATRTNQLIGTVDPFVEYLTKSDIRISFRNRWQHLRNTNDTGNGNNSDVFYSELQTQKLGAWGMEKMAMTTGIVHQYTIGEAELYTGGNEDGINTARNIAAYMQLDQPVTETLNLSMGARYEYFAINEYDSLTSQSDGKPVFRAGANYQIAEETYLRASLGQGFRFPTIAEKFIRTGLGELQVYPNLDLKPESSTSIEVGIKQGVKLGPFLGYLDVAIFQQKYSDFIEFSFGQWGDWTEPLFGLGFRSLNTGESQVRGAEVTLMGRAVWGTDDGHSLDILTGYTYTNPISLTPEFNYHPDSASGSPTTFISSSYDPANNILKYRSQNLFRFDVQWTHPKGFIGMSARYQSTIQNFDLAFVEFESLQLLGSYPEGHPFYNENPDENFITWGLEDWIEGRYEQDNGKWRVDHPKAPLLLDVRVGWNLADEHRVSLVVSNLLNKEYSVRPLAIEAPRLINLVYTYEL